MRADLQHIRLSLVSGEPKVPTPGQIRSAVAYWRRGLAVKMPHGAMIPKKPRSSQAQETAAVFAVLERAGDVVRVKDKEDEAWIWYELAKK